MKKRDDLFYFGIILYIGFGLGNYLLLKDSNLLRASMILYGCEALVTFLIFLYSQLVLSEKYTTSEWVGLGLGMASMIVLLFGTKR